MKRNIIIGLLVAILIISGLSIAGYYSGQRIMISQVYQDTKTIGYGDGYSQGHEKGYSEGYSKGASDFLRIEFNGVSYVSGNITLYFGNITLIGEQDIINFINNLPSFQNIVSFGKDK